MTIDRTSLRQFAAAMAFVMLIASLPSIGVVVAADRSGPTISMDICHPIQSLGTSSGAVQLARPAQPEIAKIFSKQAAIQFVRIPKSRFAETPDAPPPKSFS